MDVTGSDASPSVIITRLLPTDPRAIIMQFMEGFSDIIDLKVNVIIAKYIDIFLLTLTLTISKKNVNIEANASKNLVF